MVTESDKPRPANGGEVIELRRVWQFDQRDALTRFWDAATAAAPNLFNTTGPA